MSGEDIKIEVKAAIMPLLRTFIGCTISVCGFIYYGTSKIETALNDISNLKQWKISAEPEIKQHDKDITIIKTKLDIK